VLYEDRNGDERLTLELDSLRDGGAQLSDRGDDADRLYSVNELSGDAPVALVDLQQTLRELSFAETNAYYTATDGELTSFIGRSGTGYAFSLIDNSVLLFHQEHPVATTGLLCQANPSLSFAQLQPKTRASVDTALDPLSVCSTEFLDCKPKALKTLSLPELEGDGSGEILRRAQCRRNSAIEMLLVYETRIRCQTCACLAESFVDAFITNAESTPSWWPCGTTVETCAARGPLSAYDPICEPPTDAGVADASAR
jgi:hypothetical protein